MRTGVSPAAVDFSLWTARVSRTILAGIWVAFQRSQRESCWQGFPTPVRSLAQEVGANRRRLFGAEGGGGGDTTVVRSSSCPLRGFGLAEACLMRLLDVGWLAAGRAGRGE